MKETSDGAVTDSEGKFVLSTLHSFPLVLTVTFDGTSQEVEVPSLPSEPLKISFMSAYTQDKVVVIGYGTKQRKGLTGSQVKVDPAETATIPEASVDAQMQGKAAGVQIRLDYKLYECWIPFDGSSLPRISGFKRRPLLRFIKNLFQTKLSLP